jgi:AsmA-like C-terminal region/AsmA family
MNSGDIRGPAPKQLRWLLIGAGVIALLVVIALIVPLFINADAHRPEVAAVIESATGRQVVIGRIHVRLLPTAAAVVDGFQLSNPPSFAAGSLLIVDQVRGGLALGALLHGDIHLTSLELVHPKLVLSQDENGRNNYTLPSQANSGNAGAKENGGSSTFALSAIDTVTLTNADISLARIPSPGAQPFTMFEVQDMSANLKNITLDAAAIGQWQADAKLSGLHAELGAFAEPIVFLGGEVKLDKGAIDSNFQVQVGSVADLKGTLHVSNVKQPVTTFEISTPMFGADALLASLRKAPPRAAAAAQTQGAPAEPSNHLLAQGKISADRVGWTPYLGGNASAEIRIYGDRTEIGPAAVTLYGGTLQFTARTDARQTPERFSSNIKLQNLDIGHMLAVSPTDLRGKMTGHADFDLELVGSTGGAWQSALTGSGHFSVYDGTLPGVNLAGSLGVLARAAGLKETKFSSIAGDLAIKDGRVNSKQTTMDATPGTVELTGGFGLVDQSLNFSGKATLNPAGLGGAPAEAIAGLLGAALNRKVANITLPFTLSGTVAHPVFLPGKSGAGTGNTQTAAPDAIQSGLKKLLGKH